MSGLGDCRLQRKPLDQVSGLEEPPNPLKLWLISNDIFLIMKGVEKLGEKGEVRMTLKMG